MTGDIISIEMFEAIVAETSFYVRPMKATQLINQNQVIIADVMKSTDYNVPSVVLVCPVILSYF